MLMLGDDNDYVGDIDNGTYDGDDDNDQVGDIDNNYVGDIDNVAYDGDNDNDYVGDIDNGAHDVDDDDLKTTPSSWAQAAPNLPPPELNLQIGD